MPPKRSRKTTSQLHESLDMPSFSSPRSAPSPSFLFNLLYTEAIPGTKSTVNLIRTMLTTLQLLCILALAPTLAQTQATGRHQRDASTDYDVSLYITTDKVLETSPLLGSSGLHKRGSKDIVVNNATIIAATGSLIILSDSTALFYNWIAQKIKNSPDANSCTMVYGTDFDGEVREGFAYQTIPTGLSCDATASCRTIRTAMGECAERLHEARAVRRCCK